MAEIQIEVDDIENWVEDLSAAPSEFREAVGRETLLTGQMAVSYAQNVVPVRTGFLRSTIDFIQTGFLSFNFRAGAYYAGFVEYGTYKMIARPFMWPAIEYALSGYSDRIKTAIIEAFVKLVRK